MRGRRATEPMATTDITDEDMLVQRVTSAETGKQSKRATTGAARSFRGDPSHMHTPRFSTTHRNASSFVSLDRSDVVSTPGPACYETRVDSCLKDP